MTTLDANCNVSDSSSVLQDLLRDHNSEIGNWSEIVNDHQDETKAEPPSTNIDHDGPFYIFVSNLTLDCIADMANMEVYKLFGGHKNLFAVHGFRKVPKKVPHSFMLMARSFESCINVLKMDGKKIDNKDIKLEYVLSSFVPPKTIHFDPEQLDAQMVSYRNVHPQEEKQRTDPFGGAKPKDTRQQMLNVEKKILEEKAAAAAAGAHCAAAAVSSPPSIAGGAKSVVSTSVTAPPPPAAAAVSAICAIAAVASSPPVNAKCAAASVSAPSPPAAAAVSAICAIAAVSSSSTVCAASTTVGTVAQPSAVASAGGATAAAASKKAKSSNKKKKKSISKNAYSGNNKFGCLNDYADD